MASIMKLATFGVLAVIAAFALIFLAMFAAVVAYDAMGDGDMMDGMRDMMDDGMGDMIDGMDGMMGGRGPQTTGSASGRGDVRIEDFRFKPTTLNVTPGTVVAWTNADRAAHTATSNDDTFDTGRLDQGESGEITFDTPGTYDYICTLHPYMEGRIVVSTSPR